MKIPNLFMAAIAMLGCGAASAQTTPQRPNIIVILADDLGWGELGCYGQQKIKTPNLDKMAAEGQRWTQFYSGAPVCSPSRNVLLTGRHSGGCNVQDLKRANAKETDKDLHGDWPMDANQYTIPQALKKIGYQTSAFGKWGMGEYGTSGAPDKQGVDEFYGYTDHRMCHTFYPPFLWHNGEKVELNNPAIPGHAPAVPAGEKVDDRKFTGEKHASKEILKEALKYLDQHARDDKPFFLYYCPLEPHVAMMPPKEWVNPYPRDWDTEPYRGNKGYVPIERPHAGYAATISFLDDNVGKLMAKLKEKGIDQNTIVIFTSDNGTTHDAGGVDHKFFNSVADLRGLKGQTYEGGIRVPGIIRWPGKVPAGKTIDQPAYSADLMPTLCSLTGADAGQAYGSSLVPVVLGQQQALAERKPLVWTGGGYGGQAAVRIGDMKAIRRELFSAKPDDWEVYDLAKDRSESNNLAAARRDVIEQAQAVLRKEYKAANGYRELKIFAPENNAPKSPDSNNTEPSHKTFISLDRDKDGKLSFTEWKQSGKAKALATDKLAALFAKFDTDGDKSISTAEFAVQFASK